MQLHFDEIYFYQPKTDDVNIRVAVVRKADFKKELKHCWRSISSTCFDGPIPLNWVSDGSHYWTSGPNDGDFWFNIGEWYFRLNFSRFKISCPS